ncbi:unnamed protein product [Amoebophrya sp. A25]|nr:unnamed protein product [Amoebophrya sp. A25]|eukprot:GSA25T00017567001.1
MSAPAAPALSAPGGAVWTCQYRGCKSKKAQIKELRSRLPNGYPHDEDASLRVCTVCRRLPLENQASLEELDAKGLKETAVNLSKANLHQFLKFPSIEKQLRDDVSEPLDADTVKSVVDEFEELEGKSTEIVSVMRYYAQNHANQLAKAMSAKAIDDGFPWEMSLAFDLINDLVMDEIAHGSSSFGSGGGRPVTGDLAVLPPPPATGDSLVCQEVAPAPADAQSYTQAFGVLFPKMFQLVWDKLKTIAENDSTVNRLEEQKKIIRAVNQWRDVNLWGLESIQTELTQRREALRAGTLFVKRNASKSAPGTGSSTGAPPGGGGGGITTSVPQRYILSVSGADIDLMLSLLATVQQDEDQEEERELKRRKLDEHSAQRAAEGRANFIEKILEADSSDPAVVLGLHENEAYQKEGIAALTADMIAKVARRLMFKAHPDKNRGVEKQKCTDAMTKITDAKDELVEKLDSANQKKKAKIDPTSIKLLASSSGPVAKQKQMCRFQGCTDEVCSQCAHGACRTHITHCHFFARQNPGLRCFFHPPPRENAVNAVLVNGRWQQKRH